MQALETLAVAKVIKDKKKDACRALMTPGIYAVDFSAHIHGALTVNEDEKYTPTAHLPPLGVLALAMKYCLITKAAMETALLKVVTEAITNDRKVGDLIAEMDWLAKHMKRVKKMIKDGLPKETRKGKVLTSLFIME